MLRLSFVCLLVGIFVCTIHLFLGYCLGQRAEKKQAAHAVNEPVAFPQMEQIITQLRERLADVDGLASQARALSEECSRAEPKLPTHIMLRVDSLAQSSSLLQENMATMPRLLPRCIDNAGSSPTPQPMHDPSQREPVRGFDSPNMARFRYEVWQHVAPMHDGALPDARLFESVQCRDLSREGFSYFAVDLPAAEMVVVAMGSTPNLRFFAARVVSSPAASTDGKVGYQIECEFVRKLADVYEWDDEEGRIVAASEADSEAAWERNLKRPIGQGV